MIIICKLCNAMKFFFMYFHLTFYYAYILESTLHVSFSSTTKKVVKCCWLFVYKKYTHNLYNLYRKDNFMFKQCYKIDIKIIVF